MVYLFKKSLNNVFGFYFNNLNIIKSIVNTYAIQFYNITM